jgi:hypothetical protein
MQTLIFYSICFCHKLYNVRCRAASFVVRGNPNVSQFVFSLSITCWHFAEAPEIVPFSFGADVVNQREFAQLTCVVRKVRVVAKFRETQIQRIFAIEKISAKFRQISLNFAIFLRNFAEISYREIS